MNENKIEIKTINDLEDKLWKAADELRGNISAEDYVHILIRILALKFINDKYDKIVKKYLDRGYDRSEIDNDSDIFISESAYFVPEKSRWQYIIKFVGTNEIGSVLDDALNELGKANKELSGVFDGKYSYNSQEIDKTRLGEVVKIFQYDDLSNQGEDLLGRVYEYFLGKFFLKSGRDGGEFYTPASIVKIITSILKPMSGKIYDPACGTCGMLVQAKQYIKSQNGDFDKITVYGQELNSTTWKFAKLNLILNGFDILNRGLNDVEEGVLGEMAADTFVNDQHKGKVFDYIMANPPFNLKKWYRESLSDDPRWKYGLPPSGNANFAWLSHILYKLSSKGKAGVVLANGSLTSSSSEAKIREAMIKDNKVLGIITLPDKLFYTTGISASIWFFDNDKKNKNILFVDAQNLGTLVENSKKNKEITQENIDKIVDVFDKFQNGENIDIPGFAKSVDFKEIEENDYSLLPGRYISISEEDKKDPEEIKKELKQNISELLKLMDESKELEKDLLEAIKKIELD